ncbi:MAG TPA: hypothetical protein VLN49_09155 [Gemmatimonadaceae bacterium]|nr:hypothetical protein [Gemmatimonadaceae bacterium]
MMRLGREVRVSVAAAALGSLALGCTGRRLRGAGELNAEADTALFAAVVRAIADSTALPLRVDPRVGGPAEGESGPNGWLDAPPLVEMHRRVLADLGVATGSADIPQNCAGAGVPDPGSTEHRGCPPEHAVLVAIGLPRSTSPYASAKMRSYEAFRAAHVFIGPDGFRYTSYEYILTPTPRGWTLASRVPLIAGE